MITGLKSRIEEAGFECELHTDLSQMADRAKTISNEGRLRTVVSAGGDGTASTVASLIPVGIPMTLFPTGSENLLAKHFSITDDISQCVKSILRMRTKKLDLMMVNSRLSLLMASIGFDAEVVRLVHQSRTTHVSKWTYWRSILCTLLFYRWPDLQIVLRDEQDVVIADVTGSWIFAFNVPRYASGLSIIEDAVENDGLLDIGIFDRGGMLNGLRCYWAVARGKHHSSKNWRRFRSSSVEINLSPSCRAQKRVSSCQADGDWASELPVKLKIMDRKLDIVV